MDEMEDNLSDASLIEEEEEEEEEEIDLPGEPVLMETTEFNAEEMEADFHGFYEDEIKAASASAADIFPGKSDEFLDLDLTFPFPPNMQNCSGWFDGILPEYHVRFSEEKTEEDSRKVKPLKIKINAPIVPQRESREWKPSSQFFKPLSAGWVREVIYDRNEDGSLCSKAREVVYHAPILPGTKPRTFKSQAELRPFLANSHTLTLHNFSFRNDPLNAPKGEEIIRAFDEVVDIFPPKVEPVQPVAKTPEARLKDSSGTSLSPSLPSGLLKVKMFGKMKERNAFESPNSSDQIELDEDEEDFDLDIEQQRSKTQSLGNSGVTITPISHLSKNKMNIHSRPSFEMSKKLKISPIKKSRPVLRPPITSNVTCSIHCENASGFPGLSCSSCQSLYHPGCVGLGALNDYSGYDFYCSMCQPPAGKENKPFSSLGTTTITSALGSSAGKLKTKQPSVTLTPSGGSGAKKARFAGKSGSAPLRPIEAQSVVNIAGMKYLVVPHLDLSDVGKPKQPKDPGTPSKLPILLRPQQQGSEECPSFEVEESPDGKLTLIPLTSGTKSSNGFKGFDKKAKGHSDEYMKNFQSTLSSGYFAMLHVFKFLGMKDRISASKVCKLWYQISRHPSLWSSVTLKSCRVTDWRNLRDQLNRNGTIKLDLKKVLFSKSEEETWESFAKNLISAAITLNSIDLPKISPSSLHSIVQYAKDSSITRLESLSASSISCNDEEPLDLVHIGQLEDLKELKLKANSGSLNFDEFTPSLKEFVSMKSHQLTKLSLLSLQGISTEDLTNLCSLSQLEALELGQCDQIDPKDLFGCIGQHLANLKCLRLEKGKFDASIGKLSTLRHLMDLELIDFELIQGFGDGLVSLQSVRKLLLIPAYKDEVAAINAEAMDAFLSLSELTHLYFGLTTEWLDSMNTLLSNKDSSNSKDSFPILVNGVVEMFTLSKLYKTLCTSLPNYQKVKILKMPKSAVKKQYIATQK